MESFGLTAEDIQADFDPEAYDRAMEKVFDASYYAEGEEEKPQFSDLGEGEDEMEGGWDDHLYRELYITILLSSDASYSWLPESDTQEDFNVSLSPEVPSALTQYFIRWMLTMYLGVGVAMWSWTMATPGGKKEKSLIRTLIPVHRLWKSSNWRVVLRGNASVTGRWSRMTLASAQKR